MSKVSSDNNKVGPEKRTVLIFAIEKSSFDNEYKSSISMYWKRFLISWRFKWNGVNFDSNPNSAVFVDGKKKKQKQLTSQNEFVLLQSYRDCNT